MIEYPTTFSPLLTPPLRNAHDRYKIQRDFTKNSSRATTPSSRVYSNEQSEFQSRNIC